MQEVTVYGTTHCPKCQMVKKVFTSSDIPFTFVNLDNDQDKLAEIAEKVWPSTSLPIIQCGNKYKAVINIGEAIDFVRFPEEA